MRVTITLPQASTRPKELGYLCLISFIMMVGFSDKPVHIDDPLYVWTAQQIRLHPIDFHGFHLNWQNQDEPVSQFFQNPPLTCYWLAGLSLIGGTNCVIFHLGFLAFNLLSIFGMYSLAEQFCRRPFLAALMLLLCPGFLVSATTIMCEPLLICSWIWAVYFWIVAVQRKPAFFLWSSGVILLAVLTKFLAIALVPLLILYSLCRGSPKRTYWWQGVALMLPIGAAIAYEIYTIHRYGVGGFSGALVYVKGSHARVGASLLAKVSNTFAFLGGCAAVCVVVLPMILTRWITAVSVATILAFSVIATGVFAPTEAWGAHVPAGAHLGITMFHPGFAVYIQTILWTMGGLVIGVLAIVRLRAADRHLSADNIFLFVWIAGIFLFTAMVNWSINARALLPLLPPVCILVVRELDRLPVLPKLQIGFVLILSAGLAIAVACADYKVASTLRLAATQVSRIARSDLNTKADPGGTVWFAGHWGFQYYIQMTGALPLDDRTPKFKPGDVAIFSVVPYGGAMNESGFIFLHQVKIGPRRWLATTQSQMEANFYCSYGHGLPFIFGPIPAEAYDIFRVTPQSRLYP